MNNIASKCGWTPFHGDKVKGSPAHTIVAGITKMQEWIQLLGEPAEGKTSSF